jgi:hypothetical protein
MIHIGRLLVGIHKRLNNINKDHCVDHLYERSLKIFLFDFFITIGFRFDTIDINSYMNKHLRILISIVLILKTASLRLFLIGGGSN